MLTSEAKAKRLQYITGSDAAIICGASKYCTPYELWEYKTKRREQDDISDKPHVKAGIMLEAAVREWLAETIDKDIKHDDEFMVHRNYPWMGGTIDGFTVDKGSRINAVVEIKTASHDEGWGDSGSNVIPDAYRLQVAHYMAVTDCDRCYVGVLIRGVDFRHYVIHRDMDLEEYLILKELAFYECMVNDTPPAHQSYQDLVKDFINCDNAKARYADIVIEEACAEYKEIATHLEQLQKRQEQLKFRICEFMGEAGTIVDKSGRIIATWKPRAGQKRIDTELLKKVYPGIADECYKEGNPTRVFQVKS